MKKIIKGKAYNTDKEKEMHKMKKLNFAGKKWGELTHEEKETLKITGYYPEMNRHEVGEHQIIVDFENGLSVAGILVVTEDEMEIVIDNKSIIYNPAE